MPERDPQVILREVFGFDAFRGPQRAIIDHVIAGGDALVLMPTGGGKSLCYQIPALAREGVALVVSPLIALMHDQVAALRQFGVRAAYVNSSLSAADAADVERQMRRGELDLVYVAPERLCTERFVAQLAHTPLALFAIDEAHCVSQWGHDFRPEYRQLRVLHERFPHVPRIALTATADEPTRIDIADQLDLADAERFISGFDRPNIRYAVTPKQNAAAQLLRFIRGEHAGESGIVYCLSRKKTEAVAAMLTEAGHPAIAYHAGLEGPERQRRQDRFLREEGLIVVATIAFGMGIDKPDVRFVAHLDLPKSMEAYYQETGRAGRDGLASNAWMAYGLGDATTLRQFIEDSEASEAQKRIEHRKLDALLAYCETTRCRRQILLQYFGETLDEPCGNCDTCLRPVETWDASVAAQKALSCVYRTDQVFGAAHIIDVLLGNETEKVVRFRHHEVSTFGIGADLPRKRWQSVFRQLIAMGMLAVDAAHGSLRLTAEARPVLKGERKVLLRRDPEKRDRAERPGRRQRSEVRFTRPAQSELYDALRRKRLELARAQNVPPYVVFSDATLMQMAIDAPASLDAMLAISGVGRKKLEQYGQTFLEVIGAFD